MGGHLGIGIRIIRMRVAFIETDYSLPVWKDRIESHQAVFPFFSPIKQKKNEKYGFCQICHVPDLTGDCFAVNVKR